MFYFLKKVTSSHTISFQELNEQLLTSVELPASIQLKCFGSSPAKEYFLVYMFTVLCQSQTVYCSLIQGHCVHPPTTSLCMLHWTQYHSYRKTARSLYFVIIFLQYIQRFSCFTSSFSLYISCKRKHSFLDNADKIWVQ